MAELTYGIKDGKLVHISEVNRGKNCGCICPNCQGELTARQGEVREHHFSHAKGADCGYGQETALHKLAKEILSKEKTMVIPAVYLEPPNFNGKKEMVHKAKEIAIDAVELEKRINDIVPDVVVTSGGKRFIIEIFVTHRVDKAKLEKIRQQKISAIEIDLSRENGALRTEILEEKLLKDNQQKRWIYNAFAEKQQGRRSTHSNVSDNSNSFTDNKPRKKFVERPSSPRHEDAYVRGRCPYCKQSVIAVKTENKILCRCARFPVCDYEVTLKA